MNQLKLLKSISPNDFVDIINQSYDKKLTSAQAKKQIKLLVVKAYLNNFYDSRKNN